MTFHRTFRTIAGVAAVAMATAFGSARRWRNPPARITVRAAPTR